VIVFPSVESSVSIFRLQRYKKILLVFWRSTSIAVYAMDLLGYIVKTHCAFSALVVLGGS
jgi:hypothetical protein